MKLRLRNDYALTVSAAYVMLTDPAFLDAVARASRPLSHDVSVCGERVRTRRTLASDPVIRKITGPTMTIIDEVVWDPADGDERTGSASVSVANLPGELLARVRLHAGGRGALLDYDGHLEVSVPMLGRLIERQAAPVLRQAFALQQAVADAWPPDADSRS